MARLSSSANNWLAAHQVMRKHRKKASAKSRCLLQPFPHQVKKAASLRS